MKKFFVFAILLTSSLAGIAGDVADLENRYYAGLNFGAGWGDGFKMKPGVVFGYHYNKKSQFELEVLSEIRSLKNIGASLLANYRYYPNPDPVKFYVSVGLGGYLQIVPFGFSSSEEQAKEESQKMMTRSLYIFDLFERIGDRTRDLFEDFIGTKKREKKDTRKPPVKDKPKPPVKDKPKPSKEEKTIPPVEETKPPTEEEAKPPVEEKITPPTEEKVVLPVEETKPTTEEKTIPPVEETKLPLVKEMLPLVDKILSSISYKLKVGIDYEITQRIVGTVGITMGGQLSGLKAKQIPDATLEVGVRYNF